MYFQVFGYLAIAMFFNSTFGIVSTLTLLGFITVQYFAICRPLQHMSMVCKKRVVTFIILSWSITILAQFVPLTTLLVLTRGSCDADLLGMILRVVVIGADVCIATVALIYTTILFIGIRIYWEIRLLQKRLSQFRFDQEVRGEHQAFVTTLMLLTSLTLFFIPYTTVYMISLHRSHWHDHEINNSVLIYYMNLLPYIKFLSDPIIYGLRMKEIREGCRRFAYMCGCYTYCFGNGYGSPSTTARNSGVASLHMRSLSEWEYNGSTKYTNNTINRL
jgi:hypothetical protein